MRLHLLDGTYELFRAHYGRRDTVLASDGHDIHATLGILESTLALLREPGVTHLAASFDTVIESFRNEMFPYYKSSAGMDPELLRQFPYAEDALEAIGVVVWRNIEYEADDAIAAAAVRWVDDVEQVVICSPDKDMSQIVVGDRIVTYNRREQKILNEAYSSIPPVKGAQSDESFNTPANAVLKDTLAKSAIAAPQVADESQFETAVGTAIKELWADAAAGRPVTTDSVKAALEKAQQQMPTK